VRTILLSLLLALSIFGHSQTDANPSDTLQVTDQDREYAILTRLTDDLKLTTDQVVSVTGLLKERSGRFSMLSGTNAQKRTALQAINDEFRSRLQVIVSAEQWDSYLSLRKEQAEFRQANNIKLDTINDLKDDF